MTQPQHFRKRPIEITAVPWFRIGDHPEVEYWRYPPVDPETGEISAADNSVTMGQMRHSEAPAKFRRDGCDHLMDDHGWIDNMDSDYTVCPGDWIVTDARGHYHPLAPDTFKALFSPVDDYEPTSPDIARERSSSTIELPVYVSVGERGEAQQAGTVTVRVNV